MKLCSACLLGLECRYDGKSNLEKASEIILQEFKSGNIIPVCPEQLGGLPTPRAPSEIQGGMSGEYVIDGKCKVRSKNGEDVTSQFIKGAYEVLKIAKALGITEYIGAQRSPSCGCGKKYDGTFTATLVNGDGVTVALLKRNGVSVKIV
ncbi:MAG: DUF523 domain-containing protein [Candidatus Nanoarchaeia archaeon]|nr:DUF523 domain-containing protein [Candidatus Nanoarchaeia archaeon]